jgi:hypothetical protein
MVLGWSPFRIISNDHTQPSKMATMTKNRKYWQNISSETTGPIGFKLWGNSPWMVPFQNFLSDHFADQPRWLPWRSIENSAKNQFKNHLWNYWTNCDQHLGDWFLDGPFQKCFGWEFFFQCLLINFLFLVMMAISVGSRDCSDKILIGRWPSHST